MTTIIGPLLWTLLWRRHRRGQRAARRALDVGGPLILEIMRARVLCEEDAELADVARAWRRRAIRLGDAAVTGYLLLYLPLAHAYKYGH